jgi:rhamnose transport system ATP-binding protein
MLRPSSAISSVHLQTVQDRNVDEVMLRAEGIRVLFAGVEVLRGVDMELKAGEVHSIVGENGAGKSTLAKVIAGVHRPAAGTIEAFGSPVEIRTPREALSLGIALIHQEPLTFPHLTVAENVFVGHQPMGRMGVLNWKVMRARASELLQSLGARFSVDDLAGGLSVADQQLVELASALSHDAKILLMDEPTAALTPHEVEDLFKVVRRLQAEGRSIVFVSHRLEEVFAISDRITVMRDGDKVGEFSLKNGGESPTPADVVRLMVGREIVTSRAPSRPKSIATPALRVTELTRRGRFKNVHFEVYPGEIVGLAGLVGAGRTEICETIFGIARPDAGKIELFGQELRIKNPRQAIAYGLGMAAEDRQHNGLLLPLAIKDNATLAVVSRLARWGWLREKLETDSASEMLKRLQTSYRGLSQPVRQLSGGNQQKVALAKWLLSDPKVLILDEPTRGVDIGAKDEVHGLIRSLAARGIAILMASSDLNEVLELSDRVLVMRSGEVVAEIPGDEATAESVMLAATGQAADAA